MLAERKIDVDELAKRFRRAREDQGLSQQAVAEKAGTWQAAYSVVERGASDLSRMHARGLAEQFAEILGVEIPYVDDTTTEAPKTNGHNLNGEDPEFWKGLEVINTCTREIQQIEDPNIRKRVAGCLHILFG